MRYSNNMRMCIYASNSIVNGVQSGMNLCSLLATGSHSSHTIGTDQYDHSKIEPIVQHTYSAKHLLTE